MFPNYLTKFCTIIFCTFLSVASTAIEASDFSARSSLSAKEHFTAAKATKEQSDKLQEPLSTEASMQAVWHVEQALAKGYPNSKQTRVLLRELLWDWGSSEYRCYNKFKDSKDPAIQKQCAPIVAANERANNMTPELYRDYPDDPEIVSSYLVWISTAGAKNAEKEATLKEALRHSNDRQLVSELAYVLLDEGKFKEAEERFIEAVELSSDDYTLAEKLQKYSRVFAHGRCTMPSDIEPLILTIPKRYKSESGVHEQKTEFKPTKEETEDRNKLESIKERLIIGIRQAQCK